MHQQNETTTGAVTNELVITRTFNAPLDLVWQAFTEAERLLHWWGPKGVTMKVANLDLRPGGRLHYCYAAPDGHEMWGLFTYHEINPPDRLVFTSAFSDTEGNIVRAPFSADWPLEIMNTLTFTEHEGKTTLTMRGLPYQATATEHNLFAGARPSIQQGFQGTLDQLEAYLAEASVDQ